MDKAGRVDSRIGVPCELCDEPGARFVVKLLLERIEDFAVIDSKRVCESCAEIWWKGATGRKGSR